MTWPKALVQRLARGHCEVTVLARKIHSHSKLCKSWVFTGLGFVRRVRVGLTKRPSHTQVVIETGTNAPVEHCISELLLAESKSAIFVQKQSHIYCFSRLCTRFVRHGAGYRPRRNACRHTSGTLQPTTRSILLFVSIFRRLSISSVVLLSTLNIVNKNKIPRFVVVSYTFVILARHFTQGLVTVIFSTSLPVQKVETKNHNSTAGVHKHPRETILVPTVLLSSNST